MEAYSLFFIMQNQLDLMFAFDNTKLDEYIVRPDSPRWQEALTAWAKCTEFVVDIETAYSLCGKYNGLDPYRGRIRLIQIYVPTTGDVLVLDVFQDALKDQKLFTRILKQTCENPDIRVIGHNIAFDLLWLLVKYGINAVGVRDTMILSRMRYCGIKYYRHDLASVVERELGLKMSKEQQTSNWNHPFLNNKQLNYAALDVVNTYKAFRVLCAGLLSFDDMPDVFGKECEYKLSEIAKIECESIPAFVTMMMNGMPVNIEAAEALSIDYERAMEDLYAPMRAKVGLPYSASSNKMATAIYDHYNVWLLEDDLNEKDEDDDGEFDVKANQITLFTKVYPDIPKGMKLTTSSSCLFSHYVETGEEDLLRLSLVRSLKKCKDCIDTLMASAKQNGGRARTRYTSLGGTSTGRATSSNDAKSSTISIPLQTLPNPVEHALISKYNLKAPRTVLAASPGNKLSVVDYASSHLNLMYRHSRDQGIYRTFTLSDAHAYLTSVCCQMEHGLDSKYTEEYCAANKKTDEVVMKYRPISKKLLYSLANVAGRARIIQGFAKDFAVVADDLVDAAIKAAKQAFGTHVSWQRQLHKAASSNFIEVQVQLKAGNRFKQKYAIFRTKCGRLIHLEAYKNERKDGSVVWQPKISDATSCMLLSREAIALKETLAWCNNLLSTTHHGNYCQMVNTAHDECVFELEDSPEGREALLLCQQKIALDFNKAVDREAMRATMESLEKTLADNYSEK